MSTSYKIEIYEINMHETFYNSGVEAERDEYEEYDHKHKERIEVFNNLDEALDHVEKCKAYYETRCFVSEHNRHQKKYDLNYYTICIAEYDDDEYFQNHAETVLSEENLSELVETWKKLNK